MSVNFSHKGVDYIAFNDAELNTLIASNPDMIESVFNAKLKQKIEQINEQAEQKGASIACHYPAFEISTFTQQLHEAIAYKNNSSANTPLISAIAKSRSTTRKNLTSKIIQKSVLYQQSVGVICGIRQSLVHKLSQMSHTTHTLDDINAVEWPSE